MKRIISLLVSIVFLLNTTLAYTVTIIIDGLGIKLTPDPEKTVYVLPEVNEIQRWEVKEGGVTITNNEFVMPANDVKIEGVMNSYKVFYDANGGINAPQSQTKNYNENLTIPNDIPSRDDYEFLGWSTNSNDAEAEYIAGATYTDNVSVILYAVWEEIEKYTISYEANAGEDIVTDMPESQIKTHGIDLPLSGNLPTREGYNFNGWNTESNGNGTSYNAGQTYSIDADMILYAMWSVSSYNVTGTASPEAGGSISGTGGKTPGELVTLTATANTGYNFSSWEVVSGGVSLNTSGTTATFTMPENNVEVRAKFTGKTYTVTLSNNINLIKGISNTSTTTSGNIQYSISNNVITATGLSDTDSYGQLKNAYVDLTSGTEYEFSCTVNGTWWTELEIYFGFYNELELVHIYSNTKKFTAEETGRYDIRLDVNKSGLTRKFSNLRIGYPSTTQNGVCGNTVSITAPNRSGYTFNGWEVVSGDVTLASPSSRTTTFTMPAGNVEIRAKYR